jgi:hypothetical protein
MDQLGLANISLLRHSILKAPFLGRLLEHFEFSKRRCIFRVPGCYQITFNWHESWIEGPNP